MVSRAEVNGLPEAFQQKLRKLVHDLVDIFRVGFSRGLTAQIPPLRIESRDDASQIKVKLRNYSEPQREVLSEMTNK